MIRIAAIIPVGTLAGAKSRLGERLDAEEREDLVEGLLARTVLAATAVDRLDDVLVASPDRDVLRRAADLGARTLRQRSRGLNAGLREARADVVAGGADAVLVLPIDLPFVTSDAIAAILAPLTDPRPSPAPAPAPRPRSSSSSPTGTAVARTRSRSGRPASSTSRSGRAAGAPIEPPPRQPARPTSRSTARSRSTSIRPTTSCSSSRSRRRAWVPAEPSPISVLALDGIPEVRIGDAVGGLIGDAIERTPGALPLTDGDVLVVTQKIVSKAEGAVIDLTGVVPGEEALEFAQRFDRDARQVQVVLNEARRVVRMENGVLITETPHGFVCANGGVDASNVGPDSGSLVTLLPRDPDASAAGIRAAVRARFGVDVPVIVSNSFGRPWRWGIVDVAIGVSGLLPLDDLRGVPDADGRVMRSTVRAVADELASAAELALGKTAGRPVALVRGATFTPWRGLGPRARHARRERPVPLGRVGARSPRPASGAGACAPAVVAPGCCRAGCCRGRLVAAGASPPV